MSNYADYRVYGDRTHKYYIDVAAESPEIAWEAARSLGMDKWSEVPVDSVVEPYTVEKLQDLN